MALAVKNLPASAGDVRDAGLVPESRRSAGGQHYNPLQYSCLENPMDRGAWRSIGLQSRTRLKQLSTHTHRYKGNNLCLFSPQEVPQAQPPGDSPILEVEEIEQVPVKEPLQPLAPLDSGYEKHFLPTPEELGLLSPTAGSRLRPELTSGGERGAPLTNEDIEAQS